MIKWRGSPGWPNFFSLFLVVLLATNYFVPLADLDFTWQIRTGEQIVHTRQLRPVESFTYTIAGTAVPEFEGLYEVILWVVWSGFGFGGLKLLKTVLVMTPLLLLAMRLRKEGVRWHGIALALLAAIGAISTAWNLRPLYCTTIGLLLVSGWLHDHCNGRRPLTWWLPVVMCLWANLHPGVIAGQGLLLGAILCEWLNRWLKINAPLELASCWRLTLVAGTGLAATFLSPDPIDRLLYPFRPEVAHAVQRIFVEMQPAYAFLGKAPYTIWVAYLVAAFTLVAVWFRFRHFRLWEVALLAGVTGLANLAVRSLQDWVVVSLALTVPHAAVLLRDLAAKRRSTGNAHWVVRALATAALKADARLRRGFQSPAFRFQWTWPALAFGLLAVVSLVPVLSRRMPVQNAKAWPVAALDWMEAAGVHGRFFAPPDYGSYVCWRLGDRARSYVDTRGFFFPGVLIEDSHYLPQMAPGWETRLERVLAKGTDYFLLETWGAR
ncbi:MAG TPA: hypothetical protein VGY58_03895, partial [Gemmataceae bacterium]|nr:hypothetical protein [Gemmataceae bacterium]